jgi:putative hydrolase of the HAD superfamily
MIKYLLFDLDRTLWDFDGNALVTFRNMFNQYRLDQCCHTSFEEFHRYYFEVNNVLWEGYRNGTVTKEKLYIDRFLIPLSHFGLRDSTRLALQLADYYVQEGPKQTGLMPGTKELLEFLGMSRFELGVITNGFSEAQWPKMKTAGIYHYFKHFFLSEELGYMKPDIRFFAAVQNRLQASPKEIIVIGDDFRVDIVGAQGAGMPQIYYNPTEQPLPKGAQMPTYEVRNLLEIKDITTQL